MARRSQRANYTSTGTVYKKTNMVDQFGSSLGPNGIPKTFNLSDLYIYFDSLKEDNGIRYMNNSWDPLKNYREYGHRRAEMEKKNLYNAAKSASYNLTDPKSDDAVKSLEAVCNFLKTASEIERDKEVAALNYFLENMPVSHKSEYGGGHVLTIFNKMNNLYNGGQLGKATNSIKFYTCMMELMTVAQTSIQEAEATIAKLKKARARVTSESGKDVFVDKRGRIIDENSDKIIRDGDKVIGKSNGKYIIPLENLKGGVSEINNSDKKIITEEIRALLYGMSGQKELEHSVLKQMDQDIKESYDIFVKIILKEIFNSPKFMKYIVYCIKNSVTEISGNQVIDVNEIGNKLTIFAATMLAQTQQKIISASGKSLFEVFKEYQLPHLREQYEKYISKINSIIQGTDEEGKKDKAISERLKKLGIDKKSSDYQKKYEELSKKYIKQLTEKAENDTSNKGFIPAIQKIEQSIQESWMQMEKQYGTELYFLEHDLMKEFDDVIEEAGSILGFKKRVKSQGEFIKVEKLLNDITDSKRDTYTGRLLIKSNQILTDYIGYKKSQKEEVEDYQFDEEEEGIESDLRNIYSDIKNMSPDIVIKDLSDALSKNGITIKVNAGSKNLHGLVEELFSMIAGNLGAAVGNNSAGTGNRGISSAGKVKTNSATDGVRVTFGIEAQVMPYNDYHESVLTGYRRTLQEEAVELEERKKQMAKDIEKKVIKRNKIEIKQAKKGGKKESDTRELQRKVTEVNKLITEALAMNNKALRRKGREMNDKRKKILTEMNERYEQVQADLEKYAKDLSEIKNIFITHESIKGYLSVENGGKTLSQKGNISSFSGFSGRGGKLFNILENLSYGAEIGYSLDQLKFMALNSRLGSNTINTLENYLSKVATILMFDDTAQIQKEAIQSTYNDVSSIGNKVQNIHVFSLNGIYVPLSMVLTFMQDQIIKTIPEVEKSLVGNNMVKVKINGVDTAYSVAEGIASSALASAFPRGAGGIVSPENRNPQIYSEAWGEAADAASNSLTAKITFMKSFFAWLDKL